MSPAKSRDDHLQEAEVLEASFKKPMEHKKIRVQRNKEAVEKKKNLLKSTKKNLQEREATASKCGKENLLKSTKKSSSLQESRDDQKEGSATRKRSRKTNN